ncbi:magnesium transporter [Corynebacterium heidelbergense]|uniref:Magnesium transporter MgtE n=1 Tax=Corynebacterium heidelbergense TaxID=2055947 RepID=A0A364V4Y6_9CORY|nr:magnesium transporter [Corynebacterium heidelbergense]RAV31689.1 magnesium transporter [Corynebacterium heidelbergense]
MEYAPGHQEVAEFADQDLRELIEHDRLDAASLWLGARSSVEIAEEIGWLDPETQAVAFRLLDKNRALQVFEFLDPSHQAELLDSLRDDHVADIFRRMAADDQARLLHEMPAKVAARMLDGLTPQQRRATSALLGYPAESAGRLMVPTPTVLSPDLDRDAALDKLQQRWGVSGRSSHRRNAIAVVPVTTDDRVLIGMVNLSDLIGCASGTKVEDLLHLEHHEIRAAEDQETAARLIQEADLLALPVVDAEQRLLGVITVDDAMEVLEREVTEDTYRASGAEPLGEPYLSATVVTLAKKRGVWLAVLILAAFLTINVMHVFQDTLEAVVVLATFVPMIIGTGGNAGSQAAAAVIRALAVNEVRPADLLRIVWREVRVGFMLGVFLASMIIPILGFLYEPRVAITVATTVICICSWACIVGGVLPLVAKKIGVDPAVFSTPVVATLVDATGLIIYFTVANTIMAQQIAAASGAG